jgi:hydrogenase-4 component B
MSSTATALLVAAAILWGGAALAGLTAWRRAGIGAAAALSGVGGIAAAVAGAIVAADGASRTITIGGGDPVGAFTAQAQPLGSPFIFLLGLVAVAIALYAPSYHEPAPATAVYLCALNVALLASLVVLVSANAVVFLVAWETMALASYILIVRNHARAGVRAAGFLFVVLSEVGFALIVGAFAALAVKTGSLDLAQMAERAGQLSTGWRGGIFVLALVGFGFKAGLVPFHVWLPVAHPAAPADGSAFLSGLILKLGVYGIALFGFTLLPAGRPWWGLLTMLLGVVSAVLGILYALMERDIKRFLAYSSIENIGVILTALGAALVFASYREHALSAFLLVAALYHTVNHGVYKTLLFLEAGVVEHAAGTRDMDRLGGLIHRLRASAVVSLVGTMAIAALPPLNGFVSEWLIFQGLFQGFRIDNNTVGILIVVAGASLALTSGLAIMAFARAYGIPFLGMPRSRGAARASERGQPIAGPALLAAACIALAVGAPVVLTALDRIAHATTGTDIQAQLIVPNLTVIPAHTDFSALSPTYLTVFLIAIASVPLLIHRLSRPAAASRKVPVWDGGILEFRPRMQYTATTYSNPIRVTFDELYQPDVHVERASDDPAGRSGPVHYRSTVTPLFERYLYQPVVRAVEWLARAIRPIQSGDVNLYLLYVFVVVLVAYLIYSY